MTGSLELIVLQGDIGQNLVIGKVCRILINEQRAWIYCFIYIEIFHTYVEKKAGGIT